MRKLGELKNSGGFTAVEVEEDGATDLVRIRVRPPAWRAELVIAKEEVGDPSPLEHVLSRAARDVVSLILENPLVAERIDELVSRAHHEGMEAGWREGRA